MRHHLHSEYVPVIFYLEGLLSTLFPCIQQDLEKQKKGHCDAKNTLFIKIVRLFITKNVASSRRKEFLLKCSSRLVLAGLTL